jgi:hypothetical protein
MSRLVRHRRAARELQRGQERGFQPGEIGIAAGATENGAGAEQRDIRDEKLYLIKRTFNDESPRITMYIHSGGGINTSFSLRAKSPRALWVLFRDCLPPPLKQIRAKFLL